MTPFDHDDRFTAALDDCCRRVQRGEPLERCLADYPAAYREELARLAPLALHLATLRRDPAPAFQERLERRLTAAVAIERQVRRPAWWSRLAPAGLAGRAALAALVLLLLVAGGGWGVVSAAEDSLPDHPLYQVKVAREWTQLALAGDGERRVGVHAAQIAMRGRELARAVQVGAPRPVVEALAMRLGWSIERMVDQALELRARGRPLPAERALAGLRAMEEQLDRLLPQVRAEARPPLERLRRFLNEQQRRLR